MSVPAATLNPVDVDAALPPRVETAAIEAVVLELFDTYQRPLLRYARSFGLPGHDAEDVVQEVFLALFRHLRLRRSRHNLPGWLFQVTHNQTLKHRGRARLRLWFGTEPIGRAEHRADGAADPEQQLTDAERLARWERVLVALPERDRRCLLLRAEGMTYRAIATALGVSLGAVAKSMTRALARLEQVRER